MNIEKVRHSGAVMVTALVSDSWSSPWYETRTYYDYTKAESVALFREWMDENKMKEVDA